MKVSWDYLMIIIRNKWKNKKCSNPPTSTIYGGFLKWSYPKLARGFISWKIPNKNDKNG
jgi:hypothetical protein